MSMKTSFQPKSNAKQGSVTASKSPTLLPAQLAWPRSPQPAQLATEIDNSPPVRALAQLKEAIHRGYTRAHQPALQRKVNGKVEKEITEDEYPESVDHIHSQIGQGNSQTVTINRPGAKQNRRDSLRGIPTVKGSDRDEWPMAMFQEGGTGAHIEYIDPSDNRGCGSTIGCNLRSHANGTQVEFKATKKNNKQVVQL